MPILQLRKSVLVSPLMKAWLDADVLEKGFTSAIVALKLPGDAAHRIAVKNGEEPDNLHITLVYLGSADELRPRKDKLLHVLQQFASQQQPVVGKISGIGRFNGNPEKEPVYASFDGGPALGYMRERLQAALVSAGFDSPSEHGFYPHITLLWVKPGQSTPIKQLPPTEIVFHGMTLMFAGEHTEFGFSTHAFAKAHDDHPEALAVSEAKMNRTYGNMSSHEFFGEKAPINGNHAGFVCASGHIHAGKQWHEGLVSNAKIRDGGNYVQHLVHDGGWARIHKYGKGLNVQCNHHTLTSQAKQTLSTVLESSEHSDVKSVHWECHGHKPNPDNMAGAVNGENAHSLREHLALHEHQPDSGMVSNWKELFEGKAGWKAKKSLAVYVFEPPLTSVLFSKSDAELESKFSSGFRRMEPQELVDRSHEFKTTNFLDRGHGEHGYITPKGHLYDMRRHNDGTKFTNHSASAYKLGLTPDKGDSWGNTHQIVRQHNLVRTRRYGGQNAVSIPHDITPAQRLTVARIAHGSHEFSWECADHMGETGGGLDVRTMMHHIESFGKAMSRLPVSKHLPAQPEYMKIGAGERAWLTVRHPSHPHYGRPVMVEMGHDGKLRPIKGDKVRESSMSRASDLPRRRGLGAGKPEMPTQHHNEQAVHASEMSIPDEDAGDVWHEAYHAHEDVRHNPMIGRREYAEHERRQIRNLPADSVHVRNILARYDASTPEQKNVGHGWYPHARQMVAQIAHVSGYKHHQIAGALAALSPQTNWAENVNNLTDMVKHHGQGHEYDPIEWGLSNATDNNTLKAWRILNGEHPDKVLLSQNSPHSGHKVRNFYWALNGDRHAVPVDTWAHKVANNMDIYQKPKSSAFNRENYTRTANAFRIAAMLRGVEPHAMQATTWWHIQGEQNAGAQNFINQKTGMPDTYKFTQAKKAPKSYESKGRKNMMKSLCAECVYEPYTY